MDISNINSPGEAQGTQEFSVMNHILSYVIIKLVLTF